MGTSKVVVGHLSEDKFTFRSVTISKAIEWLKLLDSDELAEFTTDLLKLVDQVAKGKKDSNEITRFLSEWRETALLSQETDVMEDITEAEKELDAGGGKDWAVIKKEIGL